MNSFLFYDLETSGISPARDRIMQFAGQRTDLNLKPVGRPININVRLTPDTLPAPEAILLSGISPLSNVAKGISEAEFTEIFNRDIAAPGTIFTGFNNIRFDDEFIRYINYRNFYDAYKWHWQGSSSRWDLLDVVRMTRALRPEGINWPFNEDGRPSNRLEHLTTANNLEHQNAHDALSDTLATIEVAKLIKARQPKLFKYLLDHRSKQRLIEDIKSSDVFVYTSSHYSSDFLHTTVVFVVDFDEQNGSALVFDLRENAEDFLNLSTQELTVLWEFDPQALRPRLPVKTMRLNRCPSIAPITVLDEASIERLQLNMEVVNKNKDLISKNKKEFANKLKEVIKNLDNKRDERRKHEQHIPLDEERLYDKFIPKPDASLFSDARDKAKLSSDFKVKFSDKRLNNLYILYRARNYPSSLTPKELVNWREFVATKLFTGPDSQYNHYEKHLEELTVKYKEDKVKLNLLNDLKLYGQTILNDYGAR